MMPHKGRAVLIAETLAQVPRALVEKRASYIEDHLREACEEAVQADRRLAEKNKEALDEAIARAGASPRPTAEDALRAAAEASCVCQRLSENLFGTSHDCPVHGPHASRPTAEDALKAVMKLTSLIKPHLPEGEKGDALWCEYQTVFNGCGELLAGRRDMPAARAITGESAINSKEKGD